MWLVIFILLIVLAFAYWYLSDSIFSGGAEGGRNQDIETVAILVLKTPIGVQEMRKKFIKTDTQPPHITLGYLPPDFNEEEILKHLRSIKPNPIIFEDWRHTKSFIGLIPQNPEEIDRIIGPMAEYMEAGPRGGFHMSIAYKPQSASLDEYTHKKVHEDIHTPIVCPVKEIRISRRRGHQDWVKYKSVQY